MEFILKKMEPSYVDLDGQKIPMFFSLRAAAEMEEKLQAPYPEILDEMFQAHEEGEPLPPAMSWPRQAEVIAALIRAGGIEAQAEDLFDLHMVQTSALAKGAVQEILNKVPTAKAGQKKR